jgi:YVTN family beta-propeller protein
MQLTAGLLLSTAVFATSAASQERTAQQKSGAIEPANYDRLRTGASDERRIVVPTNQVLSPAGRQVAFSGRPTDVALAPNGRWLAALSNSHVLIINPQSGEIVSRVSHANGSYAGIIFTPDNKRLLASSSRGTIGVFDVADDGTLKAQAPIRLPLPDEGPREKAADDSAGPDPADKKGGKRTRDAQSALPIGLVLDTNGNSLWVVLNLRNSVAQVDLSSGRITREIRVGNAPYAVALVGNKLYVSNWAGRQPGPGDISAVSGKASAVRVDATRYIASDGSVSVVDLNAGKEIKQIVVGLHPCGIAATPDRRYVLVTNANSDTISVIDTQRDEIAETISTRPAETLLFGSSPSALAISPDGKTIYVANSANNAIAVIDFVPGKSRFAGCIPTGWYPGGLALDTSRNALYVANVKGVGSRNLDWKDTRKVEGKPAFGFNSHDYLGTVSLIPLPTGAELAEQTKTVLANNRLTESISALSPPRGDQPPRPIPQRHGEPSVFKHVLYIIKENRTYDQVFGDMPRGEGDPKLCIYGREITPNHHALAEQFVLLDNFYCSGVLSADGHQWTNEAYVTDYLEKAFGGFPRSYPYWGGDAMAYASSGFLWDNALARRRTLRVYGEFVTATIRWKDGSKKAAPTYLDCYQDFVQQKGEIDIRATAAIKSLEPHICPTAVGFPLTVPDVHRTDQFLKELKDFEQKGSLPNLMIMLLPADHTSGTRPGLPTPAASVADNDLALGRVVEALSHSKFWSETCIFVVQDDPQNGFDHIDGHRTVGLVISPYTLRHALDSTQYNQTSMVRTIELILGLPPMNQFDASATPMSSCFTDTADLTPYKALPNNIPLDQMNPALSQIRDARQRQWAAVSSRLRLDNFDEADEDTLNRILWHAARGRDDTYPAWAVNAEREEEEERREREAKGR